MKTGLAFIGGVVTTVVVIPVAIVFVEPVRKGFTNGICKLASIGIKQASYDEQLEFLLNVKDIVNSVIEQK